MLGNRSGFAALMKKEVPNIIVTHCILHRHALVSKCLPTELKNVMSIVVRSVNFIRGHALNHRLFQVFCQEIGSEHSVLLFHTEVRWLSRGRVLTRAMELHEEIGQFLQEKGNELADRFKCQQFILSLAYLADVFTHLNELNISMQGSGGNIMTASEKLSAFIHKLPVWKRRVENFNFANFPNLDNIFVDNQENIQLVDQICTHLGGLMTSFDGYFPNEALNVRDGWIRDPFLFNLDSIEDGDMAKDELIELKGNQKVKMEFDSMELTTFWCHQLKVFPLLTERALNVVVPFVTTYLCETGFSTLLHIKTKARNRLNAGEDMRLALSKTVPRFNEIIEKKQQQKSH